MAPPDHFCRGPFLSKQRLSRKQKVFRSYCINIINKAQAIFAHDVSNHFIYFTIFIILENWLEIEYRKVLPLNRKLRTGYQLEPLTKLYLYSSSRYDRSIENHVSKATEECANIPFLILTYFMKNDS